MEKTGKAYCFFRYDGKKEDIEGELPRARDRAETPLEMRLSVSTPENINLSEDSIAVADLAYRARRARMNYVIEGTMPNISNLSASNKVNNVMMGIYNGLYAQGEPISAVIVYKRGDKYVFKRNT